MTQLQRRRLIGVAVVAVYVILLVTVYADPLRPSSTKMVATFLVVPALVFLAQLLWRRP